MRKQGATEWRKALGLAAGLLVGGAAQAFAAELPETQRQTREFRVSVDGAERGKTTMRIGHREDGAVRVRIDSRLSVNYVVYVFRYSSSGAEVWKDGRLVELDNAADYNGTRYHVKAGASPQALQVTVNGRGKMGDLEAWSTSYWQIPDRFAKEDAGEAARSIDRSGNRLGSRTEARTIPLLDADRGRTLRGRLTRIGDETLNVAGHRKTCTHFSVGGDVQVELWYDESRRLVRMETIDQGHKTVLELMRLVDEP